MRNKMLALTLFPQQLFFTLGKVLFAIETLEGTIPAGSHLAPPVMGQSDFMCPLPGAADTEVYPICKAPVKNAKIE